MQDVLSRLADQPAFLALLALWLDRVWPRRRSAPPAWFRARVLHVARRLDRKERGVRIRHARGVLLWAFAVLCGIGLGILVHFLFRLWGAPPREAFAQVAVLAWAIAYRPARATAQRAVEGVALLEGRRGRVQAALTARTACDRLASRFSDGALGVILFFLLFGWPGLIAVRASQLVAASLGRQPSGSPFNAAVFACAGLFAMVPSWMAAALLGRPAARPRPGHATAIEAARRTPAVLRNAPRPYLQVKETRRAVEYGWWLWCLLLALGGTAAEFFLPYAGYLAQVAFY